jgi:sodium/potassium-transporting ATPase subunit alpha
MFMGYAWINAVFFVIGIVVANVPEGLTVTFTSMLSLTATRMRKINCLVKNIQSVETLGSTSVICSDKTGTLTMNKMSVAHLWFNSHLVEADIGEYITGKTVEIEDGGFMALSNVACLCSKAIFRPGEEQVPILKRYGMDKNCKLYMCLSLFKFEPKLFCRAVNGDASEAAILRYFESRIGSVAKYRANYPKLMEIPFNSRNKYQVSIHDMRDPNDPRHLLVMKGAPERIVSLCNTILVGNRTHELNNTWKNEFNHTYSQMGGWGERVLGKSSTIYDSVRVRSTDVTCKVANYQIIDTDISCSQFEGFCDCRLPLDKYPIGHEFDSEDPDFLNVGFRFVGLISMIDPPRPAVPDAVAKCRSAGIKVVMVTGDHPVTATAIARAVGILSEGIV